MINENQECCKRITDELMKHYNKGKLYQYFDDILDWKYTCNSRKEYSSSKIYVALGGPNIWIDTSEKSVELRWGGKSASWALPYDVCGAIDEIFEERFHNT